MREAIVRTGYTFDTGGLVALEKRDRRLRLFLEQALDHGWQVTVPSAVLVEWWREPRDSPVPANWSESASVGQRKRILQAMLVEPLDERLAKIAGAAAGLVGASAVDAIVMASAAQRGDVVFTSDLSDLQRLQRVFPDVKLFRA